MLILILAVLFTALGISDNSSSVATAPVVSETVQSEAAGTVSSVLAGGSLTGHVESQKQSDEAIRTNLKNVDDSAHHLQHTLHEIVYEITRQEYVTTGEPNIIGPVVIPIMSPGIIAIGGYLPPRKKYMDFFATQTQSLLTMLIEEGVSLPDSIQDDSKLSSYLALIKQNLNDLRILNNSLQKIIASGSNHDNLAIARPTLAMSDKIDQIHKLLKEAENRLNKDIKHAAE